MNISIRDLFKSIQEELFEYEGQRAVARYLSTAPASAVSDTPRELQNYDEYVKIVLLRAEKRYNSWTENEQYFEAAKLLRQYKTQHEQKRIDSQIAAAEHRGDDDEVDRLRQERYILTKEIKRA